MTKWSFPKVIREKVKFAAYSYLVQENIKREKTQHIIFEDWKIGKYLPHINKSTLSNFIFSKISQTLDLKELQPWIYKDMLYVKP